MSLLEKLLPGSYDGVEFLMLSGVVSGGRKVVKHEYPNSDRQTIEDLGLNPRTFSVTIIIGGGDNYFFRRNQILRVLEKESLAKLVHPLYGDIENVAALPYTLNEDLTTLGEGRISVVFEVSEGTGIPERSENTLGLVEAKHDTLLVATTANFVALYDIAANQPETYADAVTKGDDVFSAFDEITATVQASVDKIDTFNNELLTFQSDLTTLISAPQAYANSIQNLYATVGNMYPTVEAVAQVMSGFFIFGDTDVDLNLTTPSRIARDTNRGVLNSLIQTAALSYTYFNTSQIDFQTVAEIDEAASNLETQYKKIIVADELDDTVKNDLTDLRLTVQQFFEEQRLTAQQITTVETNLTSARLLAYNYYGSSEQGQQIAELNNISEPTFIKGPISILTA